MTTTFQAKPSLVGPPIDRIDGPVKVSGAAHYSAEWPMPDLVYGVIVPSTIANGRIETIDVTAARGEPGVLAIMTHENAPRADGGKVADADKDVLVLQNDRVYHDRQAIAVVLADSFERATHAASLVRVRYASEPAVARMEDASAVFKPDKILGEEPDSLRGDPEGAFAAAPVKIDQTYVSPVENHNPMEPHATTAMWSGDRLTVYDATQGIFPTRNKLAHAFGIPQSNVRVVTKFVGGGFGCKGSAWSHTVLAAMAAKVLDRPVKIVLSRPQMYGPVGFRPRTVQHVKLAAGSDGKLTSTTHDIVAQTSQFDVYSAAPGFVTKMLYDVPNLRMTQRLVRLNAGTPTFMRAPGETPGTFALESAMDELSYALGIDPLELRLRNYADVDPSNGHPYSSKSLRACYRVASGAFGWNGRSAAPRSMRKKDGSLLGWGMATATYPTHRSPAGATVRLHEDGSALVHSGTQDIGTGSYTVFTQVAAETLGIPVEKVHFDLGDTNFPMTPVSGGSQTAASVGSAIEAACLDALRQKRAGVRGEITAHAETKPGEEEKRFSLHSFGAQFAEVEVDPDFGIVRVTRFVGAFGAGRILNEKLARSQYYGGIVMGLGMALMEQTETDERTGRVMNANLADYLVPVNLDVPAIDVHIVPEEDTNVNPVGVKGIGEIGITGVAAALANAVYHATGVRIRELPITPDKLIAT